MCIEVTSKCFFYCKGNILQQINTQWQLQLSKHKFIVYQLTQTNSSFRKQQRSGGGKSLLKVYYLKQVFPASGFKSVIKLAI